MTNKYRILGLDDDNHSPMFVCEDGQTHYRSFKELIEAMSGPHQFEYEVKMFAIVDEWSEELNKYTEEQVDDMFDALSGHYTFPEDKTPEEIFNLFWESANRNWW